MPCGGHSVFGFLREELLKYFSLSGRWAEKMDTRLSKRFGIIGVSWPQNEKVTLNFHYIF